MKKLGERLAASAETSDADLEQLEEIIACHQAVLELARSRLDGLAEATGTSQLHVSQRAKTTQTIIEKLRRQGNMYLARMQDLAGIRIVGMISFADQDRLAAEVARWFPADPRAAKIIDRRAKPSYGYRAVHVTVSLDGLNIEVQIRTFIQHVWADLMERLADRFGRQIRYGGPPDLPAGQDYEKIQALIDLMMSMSERWAANDPATSGDPAISPDRITEMIWRGLSNALRDEGVDP